MKALTELIPENFISALGWTLFHNLWQSAVILAVLYLFSRIFNPVNRATQYYLNVLGLGGIALWSVYTFLGQLLLAKSEAISSLSESIDGLTLTSFSVHISGNNPEFMLSQIEHYFPLIIGLWIIGLAVFTLKTMGGLWYVHYIKTTSTALNNSAITQQLYVLKERLNITVDVFITASKRVTVPMVVGVLKPTIIFPIGLCTGLNKQQIEAILAHELAHIKRFDFFINLAQTIIETLFFYNPFVWYLSKQIRHDRELSCDDMALKAGIDKVTFAGALATIEQLKLNNTTMAMTLGKNKNDLLNRIKRVVEGEKVKRATFFEKALPMLIVLGALISLSWYSVKPVDDKLPPVFEASAMPISLLLEPAADTIIVEEKAEPQNTERKTQFSTTWTDDQNESQSFTIEGRDMEEISKTLEELDIPEMASVNVDFVVDALEDFDFDFNFKPDTTPFDAKQLQEEMKHFRLQQQRMIEEMEQKLEVLHELSFQDFEEPINETQWKEMKEAMEKMEREMERIVQMEFEKNGTIIELHEQVAREMEMALHEKENALDKRLKEMEMKEKAIHQQREEFSFQEHEKRLKEMEARMKVEETKMKALEKKMDEYEKALEKELRKDGYLKSGEKLEKFQYNEGGLMKVNSKEIKKEDAPKYRDMHKKFMNDSEVH